VSLPLAPLLPCLSNAYPWSCHIDPCMPGSSRCAHLANSRMVTRVLASIVLLAGLHLLVSAKRVMLGKRLLRTEAHARCVMLANNQRRSKQLAKTACLEERQMWATASSVMET
jgi:hypothetical protein